MTTAFCLGGLERTNIHKEISQKGSWLWVGSRMLEITQMDFFQFFMFLKFQWIQMIVGFGLSRKQLSSRKF